MRQGSLGLSLSLLCQPDQLPHGPLLCLQPCTMPRLRHIGNEGAWVLHDRSALELSSICRHSSTAQHLCLQIAEDALQADIERP